MNIQERIQKIEDDRRQKIEDRRYNMGDARQMKKPKTNKIEDREAKTENIMQKI